MKRGRKPKEDRKGYFYEKEEEAVVRYLNSTDQNEKERIFNEILKPAFVKMIESIIRRYKLFVPAEAYEETFDCMMSDLMTKFNYYNPERGHKAYSYYGTVCKNTLMQKINQYRRKSEKNEAYDEIVDKLSNNMDYSTEMEENDFAAELVKRVSKKIDNLLNDSNLRFTENDRRVGEGIIMVLNNWDEIDTKGTNKYNKSNVLFYLREITLLETKIIRESLKKFKKIFYDEKKKLIEENEGLDTLEFMH